MSTAAAGEERAVGFVFRLRVVQRQHDSALNCLEEKWLRDNRQYGIGVRCACARKVWERRRHGLNPFGGALRVNAPSGKGWPPVRGRVLRGVRATRTAKRRQRACGPCNRAPSEAKPREPTPCTRRKARTTPGAPGPPRLDLNHNGTTTRRRPWNPQSDLRLAAPGHFAGLRAKPAPGLRGSHFIERGGPRSESRWG